MVASIEISQPRKESGMSMSKLFAQTTLTAVAVLVWSNFSAFAADTPTPMPMPSAFGTAAPVTVGESGCASCQRGGTTASCTTCGKLLAGHLHRDKNAMYQVNLCPGACF